MLEEGYDLFRGGVRIGLHRGSCLCVWEAPVRHDQKRRLKNASEEKLSPGTVKLLRPPRQSRGVPFVLLALEL